MADDIAQWLENIGLGQYAKAFADHDVHFDVFLDLTDSDLRELGVSLGDRKRFFRATGEMQSPRSTIDAAPIEISAPRHLSEQILKSRAPASWQSSALQSLMKTTQSGLVTRRWRCKQDWPA